MFRNSSHQEGFMTEKLFVGLTFRADSTLSKKIDSFRRRFDPKYRSHSFPHMSMLAPFDIAPQDIKNLKEELKEEIESFFFGHEESLKLGFKGVDIMQTKKFNMLYLNPNYDANLQHCMELVLDICRAFVPRNIKYKPNSKQFLPLGRFHALDPMDSIFDLVKEEFSSNSELTIEGITLFRKKNGIWISEESLFSFEETKDSFLQF